MNAHHTALYIGKPVGQNEEDLPKALPFYFPADAVTQTFAILAKRGVGKTHTAVVMCEEMLANNLQVIICDPLDVWYGLRSSADGKKDGFKILVIGGEHGDLVLTPRSGTLIADFLVENSVSAILSTRHFNKTEQRTFYAEFMERLYHRKGEGQYRTPLHLVIDEADELAPQRLFPGTERVFGAVDTIVRRGRASGIGVTMISQRSAAINKDCLTQIEVLIALRTISPQDRKALEAWIDAHDVNENRDKLMDSIASLPIGTAWIWSPGWLDCFIRIHIRQRKTFDSSSTPKVGDKIVTPKKLATVDIEKLKIKMLETIEQHKSEDPKALKDKIRMLEIMNGKLEDQLKHQGKFVTDQGALRRAFDRGAKSVIEDVSRRCGAVNIDVLALLLRELKSLKVPAYAPAPSEAKEVAAPKIDTSIPQMYPKVYAPEDRDAALGKCERAILTVLCQQGKACDKGKIALLSGYSVTSSGFANAMSSLRTKGYISASSPAAATTAGEKALGHWEPLPKGQELRLKYIQDLPKCEAAILNYLFGVYPDPASREQIASAVQYSATSSGFANSLSALRTRGLITGKPDIKAADDLME